MTDTDRVVTRRTDLRREVRRADPEWDRDSKRPTAYRLSNGREFREVEGSSYEGAWISAARSITDGNGEPIFVDDVEKITVD